MKISKELKTNLIVDVENMIGLHLPDGTKDNLKRCFEITIATHLDKLSQPEDTKSVSDRIFEEIDSMRNQKEGVILMCSGEQKAKAEGFCDGLNYAEMLIKQKLI